MPRYRVTYQGRVPGAIGVGSWGAIVVDAPDPDAAKRAAWEVWEPLTGCIVDPAAPTSKLGGPYVALPEDVGRVYRLAGGRVADHGVSEIAHCRAMDGL